MANPSSGTSDRASILGPTLSFKGELSADEELLIRGRVEGTIADVGRLTISAEGVVKAEVRADIVIIEGSVEGDVHAKKSVVVKETAKVRGNLNAPAVSIQEGASFNGGICMDAAAGQTAAPSKGAATSAPRAFAAGERQTRP